MVNVSPKDYVKAWRTLKAFSEVLERGKTRTVRLSEDIVNTLKKEGRITSENVMELLRRAGLNVNNSTIRRLIYGGIQVGIVKSEFIHTGSMRLNRYYIPEKYEIDVGGYRSKLLKKLDSYFNVVWDKKTEGFGFAFKCLDCGNPLIPPTELSCPVCGSQNLDQTTLEEVKGKYFDLVNKMTDNELIEVAGIEVEGGVPAVVEFLTKKMLKKKR